MEGAAVDPDAPLVVCLHGVRMNEALFARLLVRLFDLPLRFLFLRASIEAPPLTGQTHGASWYDYDGNQDAFQGALEGVEEQVRATIAAVERAEGLTPASRVLLGFSQGAYCGSVLALRHPEEFSGLIVSGARVKTEVLTEAMPRAAAAGMQVLLCHGRHDAVVPPDSAERSLAALLAAGVSTELVWFESGHSMGRRQVETIRGWLGRKFEVGASSPIATG